MWVLSTLTILLNHPKSVWILSYWHLIIVVVSKETTSWYSELVSKYPSLLLHHTLKLCFRNYDHYLPLSFLASTSLGKSWERRSARGNGTEMKGEGYYKATLRGPFAVIQSHFYTAWQPTSSATCVDGRLGFLSEVGLTHTM